MRQDLNNSVTLVLPDCLSNEIDAIARLPVETAGVLLASIVTTPEGDTRILGRRIRWVADSAYIRRGGDHLSIASEGYVPYLAEAEALGAAAIWLHTHPGIDSSPRPSEHDEEVDRQISDLFRLRAGSPYYGAVIFSPRRQGLAFTVEPAHQTCGQEDGTGFRELAVPPHFPCDLAEDGRSGCEGRPGTDAALAIKHHAGYLPAVRP